MASAFSHVAVPLAIGISGKLPRRWIALGMLMSAAPDLDVIAFFLGVPYESPWGHRGFTHSVLFAGVVATILGWRKWRVAGFLFLAIISHAVLDAFTNGGLGVAFFWPFDNERYFLPWRVIRVSPIGIREFFGERGLAVLKSELVYIWLPCLIFTVPFVVKRLILSRADRGPL